MKKVLLENGLTVVLCNRKVSGSDYTLSLTFKCGHVTEPKLGLASLYEKIVSNAEKSLTSFCGGNITSFYTRGNAENLDEIVAAIYSGCVAPSLTRRSLYLAMDDIIQHTKDLAPLPMRQTKLAYKHTAFGTDNVVWDTAEYIRQMESLEVRDVKEYIDTNLVGNNVVIGFTGPNNLFDNATEAVKKRFGALNAGQKHEVKKLLYTGGYQYIKASNNARIAMLGWDITNHVNYSKVNVLMSMLSARLERSLAERSILASVEVKIAGYFGFRTLRVCVSTNDSASFIAAIHVVCVNIRRLRYELASDRRMETSRQRAMTERLAAPDDRIPRSVEAAWLLLGRGKDYDNDSCIDNICQVDAYDIQDTARTVFAEKLTYVVYSSSAHPSYDVVVRDMSCC